jgi:aldehyde dehydrogenase (NAD+)
MQNNLKFYINGEWVDPAEPAVIDVINPATELPFTQISAGSPVDIDRAVAAARAAVVSY